MLLEPYVVEDGIANCLLLHDWSGELDQRRWFEVATQFLFEVGSAPAGTTVIREDNNARRPRLAALEALLRQGERFKGITLNAQVDRKTDPYRQPLFTAGFSHFTERKKSIYFICDSRGLPIEPELFADLTYRVTKLVGLTYGYGFQKSFVEGPEYFALDLVYGNKPWADEDHRRRMTFWYWERLDMTAQNKLAPFRHLQGMLRDVFPFNVLMPPHLISKVDGVPLEQWIKIDRTRGFLSPIAPDLWSWNVPEAVLPSIQDSLQRAGLLIERPAAT